MRTTKRALENPRANDNSALLPPLKMTAPRMWSKKAGC
jgi:hypothetical protein